MVKINKSPFLTTISSWDTIGELSRHGYRTGYLSAANILAETLKNTEGFDARTLSIIYPVMNLYRHFIELTLKDFIDLAIFVGPDLLGRDVNQLKPKRDKLSHDLKAAYEMVKEIQLGREGIERLEFVEIHCKYLIDWFYTTDPRGDGFRYALTKKHEAQFAQSFNVDLLHIQSKIKNFDIFMWQEHQKLRQLLDEDATTTDMEGRIYKW